jgi:chromate transport protein ChrA
MIIGQSGWIGFIAYAIAIVMLFIAIQRLYKFSLSFYASALIGLVYLLIASTAESAFVNPVAIPIAAMIGFMLSQKDKDMEKFK